MSDPEVTDLVPVETGNLPTLADPAALGAALETYSAARATLMGWIDGNLAPGTDYLLIHRGRCAKGNVKAQKRCDTCGGKACLTKPGAEKIDGCLQVTPRFRRDVETWEMLGQPSGVLAYVCELVNKAGEVVSEGRGCRSVETDGGDPNKSVKMAQKSAQIDATLRYAGLSEVFTLDLDDPSKPMGKPPLAQRAPKAQESPRQITVDDRPFDPEEPPHPAEVPVARTRPVEPRCDLALALEINRVAITELGWAKPHASNWLHQNFGVYHVNELDQAAAERALAALKLRCSE